MSFIPKMIQMYGKDWYKMSDDIRVITKVRYDNRPGPWITKPEGIRKAFESEDELLVISTYKGESSFELATYFKGEKVLIGGEQYLL